MREVGLVVTSTVAQNDVQGVGREGEFLHVTHRDRRSFIGSSCCRSGVRW